MSIAPYTPSLYQRRHYGRYRSYPRMTVTPIPGAGYDAKNLIWEEQPENLWGAVPGMPMTQYGNYTNVPLLGLGDVDPSQVMNVANTLSQIFANPDATLRAQGPAIVTATDKYLLSPLTDAMAKHMMPYFWKYAAPAFAVLYLGVGVSAYYSFLALEGDDARWREGESTTPWTQNVPREAQESPMSYAGMGTVFAPPGSAAYKSYWDARARACVGMADEGTCLARVARHVPVTIGGLGTVFAPPGSSAFKSYWKAKAQACRGFANEGECLARVARNVPVTIGGLGQAAPAAVIPPLQTNIFGKLVSTWGAWPDYYGNPHYLTPDHAGKTIGTDDALISLKYQVVAAGVTGLALGWFLRRRPNVQSNRRRKHRR